MHDMRQQMKNNQQSKKLMEIWKENFEREADLSMVINGFDSQLCIFPTSPPSFCFYIFFCSGWGRDWWTSVGYWFIMRNIVIGGREINDFYFVRFWFWFCFFCLFCYFVFQTKISLSLIIIILQFFFFFVGCYLC